MWMGTDDPTCGNILQPVRRFPATARRFVYLQGITRLKGEPVISFIAFVLVPCAFEPAVIWIDITFVGGMIQGVHCESLEIRSANLLDTISIELRGVQNVNVTESVFSYTILMSYLNLGDAPSSQPQHLYIEDNHIGDLMIEGRVGFSSCSETFSRNRIGSIQREEREFFVSSTYHNNTIGMMRYQSVIGALSLLYNDIGSLSLSLVQYLSLNVKHNVWRRNVSRQSALSIASGGGSQVTIDNCSFEGYDDVALSLDLHDPSTIRMDSLRIENCTAGGIQMKLDRQNNTIRIKNCTMIRNTSPIGSAIFINSDNTTTHVEDTYIQVPRGSLSTSDYSTVVVLHGSIQRNNTLICPEEMVLYSPKNQTGWMLGCAPCGRMQYLIGRGEMINGEEKRTECSACSSDMDCTEHVPQAQPGWWCGVDDEGEIGCKPCPSGYCNRIKHPWNDSCIGNRGGILCGGCTENHTLSFLTSACLPLESCKSGWLSLLAVIPFIYVIVLLFLPIGDGSIWKSASYYIQTLPLIRSSSSLGLCLGQLDYTRRELLSLYIPLSTVAILAVGCVGLTLYNRRDKKHGGYTSIREEEMTVEVIDTEEESKKRTAQSRFTTAMITAFLLVYSGILSICLKLLFCVQIQGEYWEVVFMLRRFFVTAAYVSHHHALAPFSKNAGQDLEALCLVSLCCLVVLGTAGDSSVAHILNTDLRSNCIQFSSCDTPSMAEKLRKEEAFVHKDKEKLNCQNDNAALIERTSPFINLNVDTAETLAATRDCSAKCADSNAQVILYLGAVCWCSALYYINPAALFNQLISAMPESLTGTAKSTERRIAQPMAALINSISYSASQGRADDPNELCDTAFESPRCCITTCDT
ncbi:hypothetical protein PROFUN_07696 [Planoprotostelium fungivorum]|uniref:Right handed beta helix domain-containing protein n=1 Tax=Planoprotostelium fungivorum TaxID=1890364 RepID=A0A2P6MM69_9EUKA|nr:hypothetical protein PROFUN_07696 [Planoprotostelium fungivorum]